MLPLLYIPSTANIINASAYNLSNVTSLFQFTNKATGGLEGYAIMLILFVVITVGLSFRYKIANAALGAAMLCTVFALLLQQIGIVTPQTPLLFIGVIIICAILNLLSGFLRPYG